MHLVLADDHQLVLDALRAYISKLRPETRLDEATNFDQAVEKVSASDSVDLVILDLNMPGMNGLDGLDVMKERFPHLPVVLLSGATDAAMVREALKRGANGFIPKELSGQAMLRALELVMSGEAFIPAMVLSDQGVAGKEGVNRSFGEENPLAKLTRRERQVLSLLIEGQSNKEIARKLGLQEITVAFHLKGLFRKLNASTRTEVVVAAVRAGWEI